MTMFFSRILYRLSLLGPRCTLMPIDNRCRRGNIQKVSR
jgi:hypothetical protein